MDLDTEVYKAKTFDYHGCVFISISNQALSANCQGACASPHDDSVIHMQQTVNPFVLQAFNQDAEKPTC
jgi:hypothetical protein